MLRSRLLSNVTALSFAAVLCSATLARAQTDASGFFTEYLVAGGYENPLGCGQNVPYSADWLCDGAVSESDIVPEIGLELGLPVADAGDCEGSAEPALQGGFHVNSTVNQNGNLEVELLLADANQLADFDLWLGGADNVMAYAWIWVENTRDEAQNVTLELASDDSVVVDVNRNEVWVNAVCRGSDAAGVIQDRIPITLVPGGNLIQFKVFEQGGGHNLRARLSGPDCTPLLDGDLGLLIGTDPLEVPDLPITTRSITPVQGGADIELSVEHGGQAYTLEERFDAGWELSNVSPAATAMGEGFVRWENASADTLSYSLRRADLYSLQQATPSGTMTIGDLRTVVEGDRAIPGSSPAYVGEVLVTASLALPAGQTGCTVNAAMISGKWIDNGDDITDRTIIPEEGLEIEIDFGGASQATGLTAIGNDIDYWSEPGDPAGGMILVRETSGDGFYDWQRADIYSAAPDPDNTMNAAFFYAINPTDEPMFVIMGFGSDDGGGVRVNGYPVLSMPACRGFPGYTDKFRVRLDPGKNLIGAYTFEAGGGYTMGIRFEDESFQPIPIQTTLDPSGYDPDDHAPQSDVPPIEVSTDTYVRTGPSAGFITEWLVPAQIFDTGQAGNTLAGALPEDYISQNGGPVELDGLFEGAVVEPGPSGLISTAVRGSACGFTTLVKYSGFEDGLASDPGDFDGEVFYGAPDNYSTSMLTVVTNKTDDDLEAVFGFTSDDAGTLFVNGENVSEFLTPRGRAGANTVDTFPPEPVILEPGPNLIQMSFNEAGGGSGARVRMLSLCGVPFTEDQVSVSANPPDFTPPITATRTAGLVSCEGSASVTISFSGAGSVALREELPAGITGSNPSKGTFNAGGTVLTFTGDVAEGDTITYDVAVTDLTDQFCASVANNIPIAGDLSFRRTTDVCIDEDELTEIGYFINAGSTDFEDSLGRTWHGDTLANPSQHLVSRNIYTADFGLLTVTDIVSDDLIAEREYPMEIFPTERWDDGDIMYRFSNLPRGCYEVVLLFMEGCCSEGCLDIEDPQQSGGNCRVFDILVNGEIVADQFSQDVAASRLAGTAPGAASFGIGVSQQYYVGDTTQIDITIDDLGGGNPPENASIKAIAIRKLTAEEAAEVGEECGAVATGGFIRGNADGQGAINITDGVFVLNYLFTGGGDPPCKDAADADDSGVINITDGVYILNFLFTGGADPRPPFPNCGPDPTDDSIDCLTPHAACQ